MFNVTYYKELTFLHKIIEKSGDFGVLHEHNARVCIKFEIDDDSVKLNPIPLSKLEKIVNDVVLYYDSININTLEEFKGTRYLIEDLAQHIFNKIEAKLAENFLENITLIKVTLYNNATNVSISYYKKDNH